MHLFHLSTKVQHYQERGRQQSEKRENPPCFVSVCVYNLSLTSSLIKHHNSNDAELTQQVRRY